MPSSGGMTGSSVAPQVFYFHEQPYPATTGHFSGRVTWDGNIQNKDASLMLWNVSPADNGTFQCQVKNPPDVDGNIGEIQLAVVLKGAQPLGQGEAAGGEKPPGLPVAT